MNAITYILVLLTTVLVALSPILKKVFDRIHLSAKNEEFDLLHKLVGEAVSYVNQISLIEDLPSERKKELALMTAKELATKFGIPESSHIVINNLIESILWKEDDISSDDDDDFDD